MKNFADKSIQKLVNTLKNSKVFLGNWWKQFNWREVISTNNNLS